MLTFTAPTRVATTRDTPGSIRALVTTITKAVAAHDKTTVKDATASLHRELAALSTKQIQRHEDTILEALRSLPYNRGAQVASWLQAHVSDYWSRAHWAAIEDILER